MQHHVFLCAAGKLKMFVFYELRVVCCMVQFMYFLKYLVTERVIRGSVRGIIDRVFFFNSL